jgi:signal transduction histidine kinase
LTIDVRGPQTRLPLSQEVETQLFAIAREALANVVRHAGANVARVRVEPRGGHVIVEIIDDGCGFDPREGHPGHFGLESMRSRATEIDGRFAIASAPGRGTHVRVRVPADGAT